MVQEKLIKVWSIIPVAAYEQLEKKGWLGGDGRRVWKHFRRPYLWMIEQMRNRLGPSPTGSDYPVWVWHQWTLKQPKPDLRSSGHLNPGVRGYRLELLIPKAKVLLSDFNSWHDVLNNVYCGSETENEQWEADVERARLDAYDNVLPVEFDQRRRDSWEKIFEIADAEYRIQGTAWKIERSQVIQATPFIAR